MSQVIKLWDGTVLPDVETLTGNIGGAVGPTGGNINVLGDGTTCTIVGDPGTSTLTVSVIDVPGDVETLTGDIGGAVSADGLGNINIVGDGTTCTITGNPGTNTLTVSVTDVPGDIETVTGNSGGAVSADGLGNINIVGDGVTVDVTGNPGTNTLTASFIGTTDITITGDTGGAQVGDSFTFNGGTTGLSFGGAADVFTTTFAGITANGGTVSLATDATNSTVNVGTGAGVKTSTFGSTNTTSTTTLQSGSGALNVTSTNGALTVNSGTGALSISNDASATTVTVATGAAVKTLTVGSTNTTSSTVLRSGTGNIAMNSGLTVDSTGRMTNAVQPAFFAYFDNSIANVTGDGTLFVVGTGGVVYNEVFDQGSNFVTTGTFTAPKTGRYRFTAATLLQQISAGMLPQVSITTTALTYTFGFISVPSTSNQPMSISVLASMTAGDTATFDVRVNGGTKTVDIYGAASDPRTYFCGELVC